MMKIWFYILPVKMNSSRRQEAWHLEKEIDILFGLHFLDPSQIHGWAIFFFDKGCSDAREFSEVYCCSTSKTEMLDNPKPPLWLCAPSPSSLHIPLPFHCHKTLWIYLHIKMCDMSCLRDTYDSLPTSLSKYTLVDWTPNGIFFITEFNLLCWLNRL